MEPFLTSLIVDKMYTLITPYFCNAINRFLLFMICHNYESEGLCQGLDMADPKCICLLRDV